MLLYTRGITANRLEFGDKADPIEIRGTLGHASGQNPEKRAPYLSLVLVANHREERGYAALRAYAQPIFAASRFVPVESDFERRVLRLLIQAQHEVRRIRPERHITIRKPLFAEKTPEGPCRPDFIVDIRDRVRNGEIAARGTYVIEAMGYQTDEYAAAKLRTHPRVIVQT